MSALPNKKILLVINGSEDAALSTRAAVELSRRGSAELHLVHGVGEIEASVRFSSSSGSRAPLPLSGPSPDRCRSRGRWP
jgi:uncharacterized metal-binding protein